MWFSTQLCFLRIIHVLNNKTVTKLSSRHFLNVNAWRIKIYLCFSAFITWSVLVRSQHHWLTFSAKPWQGFQMFLQIVVETHCCQSHSTYSIDNKFNQQFHLYSSHIRTVDTVFQSRSCTFYEFLTATLQSR